MSLILIEKRTLLFLGGEGTYLLPTYVQYCKEGSKRVRYVLYGTLLVQTTYHVRRV